MDSSALFAADARETDNQRLHVGRRERAGGANHLRCVEKANDSVNQRADPTTHFAIVEGDWKQSTDQDCKIKGPCKQIP